MSIIKNIQEPLLSLQEVSIIPSKITKIHSRTHECNARMSNGKLPIFISPMNSIINKENFDLFNKDTIAILPRTYKFDDRLAMLSEDPDKWIAFGLNEICRIVDMIVNSEFSFNNRVHICIDQANGHMEDLIEYGKKLRERFVTKDSEIMIGNIANPRTYTKLAYNDFADWVRIGIGGGSVCTTSVQTGVHYPMASLISECHYYKSIFEFNGRRELKIVADGGMSDSGDICKALALGADAVMCGRMFVGVKESSSEIVELNGEKYKAYWGMSTKIAQRDMNGVANKNSEGILDYVKVTGTLDDRVRQIESSIKSAMSYCNAYNLEEFKINSVLTRITPVAFNAYHKEIQNI